MADPKCVAGCAVYTGGEIKHHKSCPFYPESLSKMYDDLKAKYLKQTQTLNYAIKHIHDLSVLTSLSRRCREIEKIGED